MVNRHSRLYDAFDRAIDEILGGRILPFDRTAAETAATIAATQRQVGRPAIAHDLADGFERETGMLHVEHDIVGAGG